MHRTHTCGELSPAHIDTTVTLCGWVANRRDHGGVVFIDVRDRYGITQMVFDPIVSADMLAFADGLRSEYVVKLSGIVRARPEGQSNAALATGDIEVLVSHAEVLAESRTPPFEISDHTEANEEIRLKYRYLDLRRRRVTETILRRADANLFVRNWFTREGFTEVQTPLFTTSSPEGARDYLIPSRLHHGKFYALPQAPQQYKQLLMVGGLDKYFQIAPCFRDEDPRADRHSCEFYQIDCEMSFVEQDDIFAVAETFLRAFIAAIAPEKRIISGDNPFPRLTHEQSASLYGSDRPDLRFDLHFEDLTETFRASAFSVFRAAVEDGGVVKAMKLAGHTLSRSEIDALTDVARSTGAKGLAYIIYDDEGAKSPILKFFSEVEIQALESALQPRSGDMIFFGAGAYRSVVKTLGVVRLALRDQCQLVDKHDLAFGWVTDFPMFEEKEDGSIDFEHNPLSMPHGGAKAFDNPNPLDIRGMQYDMTCNGYEILSGSIRNHDLKALVKAFEIVGRSEKDVREKFGAMYQAFQYGVPPHGGFAFGFDRLFMVLCDETNIREIYAFPKSGKAEDTMMNAPSIVDDLQLKDLGVQLRPEVEAALGRETVLGNAALNRTIKERLAKYDVKTLTHVPVRTSKEASQVRGTNLSEQAKALILKRGNTYILCVVPADRELDLARVAAVTGQTYVMAAGDDIRERFGLIQGSVPPFGSMMGIATYIDTGITRTSRLSFNIALLTESVIGLPTSAYLETEAGTVVDIAKVG